MSTFFKYKIVRCEWQVALQSVGQYGESIGEGKALASFPTYDEAFAARPEFADESPYVKGRWHPKGKVGGYEYVNVIYREVEWEK